ncbi:hypothetical protein L3Q72_02505 [Vibrio sp. JC009]|uniref:hypothetical protein n=1 Tax=Vibrio sp. JC009 TaxID=2912314 RepID=UPI0023B1A706|nr:hypothetical protein [Vibrio sp. JC009]WED22293.1 hypothetical protein L3Q72_02505 [Vibrio sp. JC009]
MSNEMKYPLMMLPALISCAEHKNSDSYAGLFSMLIKMYDAVLKEIQANNAALRESEKPRMGYDDIHEVEGCIDDLKKIIFSMRHDLTREDITPIRHLACLIEENIQLNKQLLPPEKTVDVELNIDLKHALNASISLAKGMECRR